MNKATYDYANKMHAIIMTLGITMLMLLILVSLAGAGNLHIFLTPAATMYLI